ncbi:damage-inducible protein CinA [Candidatus Endobugula sertula]|uniref:Damage-inducible protein CinA n=1 Tax=Candidatus Endobugula sertula TaxID=62101 RepID=A0A1D2QQC5_9GAMM|nr:damage-inducible protein CinA [Candidatus Endobugula sertula]
MELKNELSVELGQYLRESQWMVTTAESCTGGGIAQAITNIAGSSQWFTHGFVTYSNLAKQQLLGVDASLFDSVGAVSSEVVEAMAEGAKAVARADFAIAVSGIAGPGGGSTQKPVGTVWIGWSNRDSTTFSQRYLFSGNRQSIRNQSIIEALKGLIKIIKINTV